MSLLIDALKKAEEAKRRAAAAAEGKPEAAARQPETPDPGLSSIELDRQLRALDARTAPARAAFADAPADATAQAARNLFEVKAPPRQRHFALVLGTLTLLSSAGIAFYFYLQLRPSGAQMALLPSAALTAMPAGPPARTAAEPPPDATAPVVVGSPVARQQAPRPTAERPPAIPHRGTLSAETPADPAPPPPLRIPVQRGSSIPPAVPATLADAWRSYQAGDLAAARAHYQRALGEDPRSLDALNGLGAVALRSGQADEAARWFRRSLEVHPGNAVALGGLAGLQGAGSDASRESRLRALLAEQPQAAELHFALGNLLAAERRWGEAQASYFKAYDLDRRNPDFLFNLAVSLDHLTQPGLAGRFYREALESSRERPHAFAREAAELRLAALGGP